MLQRVLLENYNEMKKTKKIQKQKKMEIGHTSCYIIFSIHVNSTVVHSEHMEVDKGDRQSMVREQTADTSRIQYRYKTSC